MVNAVALNNEVENEQVAWSNVPVIYVPYPTDGIIQINSNSTSGIITSITSCTNIFNQNTYYPQITTATSAVFQPIFTTSIISTGSTYFYYSNGVNYASSFSSAGISKPKRGPLIKKSIRSSIKRAMKLIANFGMEEDVKIFLDGDSIEVSNPDSMFKFVMTKKNNTLIRYTEYDSHSTPYKLELYTKTNIHVADLCVVLDKTPILDQILAISLFIKSGDEEEILSKANFLNLSKDIKLRKELVINNPYLKNKLKINDRLVEEISFTEGTLTNIYVQNTNIINGR